MIRKLVLLALLLAPQQNSFWSQNYATGLVGWWKLGEGTGSTAYDSSGYGNSGAWAGTAAGTSGYYSAGYVGPWAGYFNGSNDKLTVSSSSVPTLNVTGPLTICAWVNIPSIPSMQEPIYSNSSGFEVGGVILGIAATGEVSLIGNRTGAWWQVLSSSSISTNNWHHVAGVYTGAAAYVYVDGALKGSLSTSSSPASGGGVYIGYTTQGGFAYFNGLLDDVRVYNRALSAGEIAGMYKVHN
jgi:hypothetical protein